MARIRHLLVPVTLAWLFVHASIAAGAAGLLIASHPSEADLVCQCGHGADHGQCPMHRDPAGSARCRLQGTQHDLGLALLSMLGPLTLPVAAVDIVAAISTPLPAGYDATLPLDWTAPPESPPPRS